jgi:hypothetical protein
MAPNIYHLPRASTTFRHTATRQPAERHETQKSAQARELLHIDIGHEGLTQQATLAFTSWPTLERCAIELYEHLGQHIVLANQKPLARATIGEAIRVFDDTLRSTHHLERAVLAFLTTTVNVAEILCSHVVYVTHSNQSTHRWMPFKQSYDNWLSDNAGYLHIQIQTNPFVFDDDLAAARRRIASITLSHADYARVFGIDPYQGRIHASAEHL